MDSVTKSYGAYGGICAAWDCGVSMASICREYPSLGTKIIHGKFRENGACGFVLKPEKFRFPSTERPVVSVPLTLAVHIISGQELPEAALDPESSARRAKEKGYAVVIDLNGTSFNQSDVQAKTLYIKKHGRNPFWNEVNSPLPPLLSRLSSPPLFPHLRSPPLLSPAVHLCHRRSLSRPAHPAGVP